MYTDALKKLREQMSFLRAPVSTPTENSFISQRPTEATKEAPEDILSRNGGWLSTIRESASESLKKMSTEGPTEGGSFASGLANGVAGAINTKRDAKKKAEEEAEATEKTKRDTLIERRSRPSAYAPGESSSGPNPGYGDISQKSIEEVVKAEAALRNIDPDVAVAIFRSEGAGSYQSQVKRSGKGSHNGLEDSYGPFQLYRGGGLGHAYEKETGRNLREDNTLDGITNQIRYGLDAAVAQGWTPWYGRKTAGVGVKDGLSGAKKIGNWN